VEQIISPSDAQFHRDTVSPNFNNNMEHIFSNDPYTRLMSYSTDWDEKIIVYDKQIWVWKEKVMVDFTVTF
jgi:hypothetical protein